MKKEIKPPLKSCGVTFERERDKPVLIVGYPSATDEDDDDDGATDVSSLLKQGQSPFKTISSSLYNTDYAHRIIVIDEQIDDRCFTYAKMIENWNREDKAVLAMRDHARKLVKKDPEVNSLFSGFNLKEWEGADNLEELEAKAKEKAEALIEKYPELVTILSGMTTLGIAQTEILSYEPTPIRIKFNSPGGWLLGYQTLADVITLSKTKVIGINMGMAYSAAAFLLVSCHERLALPKSRMMVHRGSGGNYGSFEQTESSQQNYKEQVDEMIKSFQKRTKIPSKVLKKNMNPDWYLSAQMALKHGLIDKIVTDINEII